MVVQALKLIGFVEYDDPLAGTHTQLWALRDGAGGSGVSVRVPGFVKLPDAYQRWLLSEARIPLSEWQDAIEQAERALSSGAGN